MPEYTQADRPMRVDTELEEDALLLASFTGRERVSAPYEWEVRLLSEDPSIAAEDLLRTPMLLTIGTPTDEDRLVHGLVRRFVQLGQEEELTTYRAELVPWFWFLSLTRDCQVFQDKDVLEIVEEVFDTQGYSDYDIRCTRNYPERDFCVQYRESHLNFISRLLEEEGIFYFFEHSEGKHTLVITDDNSKVEPCPGQEEARIRQEGIPEEDVVTSLVQEHSVNAGEVSLADYDYLQPGLSLQSSISGDGDGEVRDYHPRRFTSREEGDRKARLLMELEESRRQVIRGEGTCRAFRSGHRFELVGHYRRDVNQDYMLVEIEHSGRAGDIRSWESAGLDYRNEFLAIPHDVPYRPPRRAEKPTVQGSQTALVVGKKGEEIWTEKHGRIKVQFHWDREGKKDENSSCWVRVATRWAGKSWGEVHLPRIGQEVVVDFLEGDPDRPLVTGSVYNADYPPPYAMDGAGKTKSGMKSRSSKGGGGYNEISIDDKKGSEKITVHAQKDMSTTVGNDQSRDISNNRSTTVGADDSETVGSNQTLEVGGNREKSVSGDQDAQVAGSRSRSVGSDETITVGGDQKITVSGKIVTSGGAKVRIESPVVEISGDTKIKLSVGGTSLELTPGSLETVAAAITTTASASHEIKGAMVKHNC